LSPFTNQIEQQDIASVVDFDSTASPVARRAMGTMDAVRDLYGIDAGRPPQRVQQARPHTGGGRVLVAPPPAGRGLMPGLSAEAELTIGFTIR